MVSADTSLYGIGMVISQKHGDFLETCCYGSRSMSETEPRYSNLETDNLGLVRTCERTSNFLISIQFILETDSKSIIPFLNTKDLTELTLRLQRFRMRLMRFDYQIRYTPGSKLVTADFHSRAPLCTPTKQMKNIELEIESYVNLVISSLPAISDKLEQILLCYPGDVVCSYLKL